MPLRKQIDGALGNVLDAGHARSSGAAVYGQNGTDGPHGGDNYVYAVSNDGSWNNGTRLILGRVRRSDLPDAGGIILEFLSGSVYLYRTPTVVEFFAGPHPLGHWELIHRQKSVEGWYNPAILLKPAQVSSCSLPGFELATAV